RGGSGGAGGEGGDGGDGGDAQGGGLFVDSVSTIAIYGGAVTGNAAIGGPGGIGGLGGDPGNDGQGIGGEIYLGGDSSTRKHSRIADNDASTSRDSLFGILS